MTDGYEMRPIPGYPGYYADTNGDIFTSRKYGGQKRVVGSTPDYKLKPMLGYYGYAVVGPSIDGKATRTRVHTLVALAFHDVPAMGKREVRHLNDVRSDNRPSNLAWGTHKQNLQDAVRNGSFGRRRGRRVLKVKDVVRIRERRQAGETYASIAKDYNISSNQIRVVCVHKSWEHVA